MLVNNVHRVGAAALVAVFELIRTSFRSDAGVLRARALRLAREGHEHPVEGPEHEDPDAPLTEQRVDELLWEWTNDELRHMR